MSGGLPQGARVGRDKGPDPPPGAGGALPEQRAGSGGLATSTIKCSSLPSFLREVSRTRQLASPATTHDAPQGSLFLSPEKASSALG